VRTGLPGLIIMVFLVAAVVFVSSATVCTDPGWDADGPCCESICCQPPCVHEARVALRELPQVVEQLGVSAEPAAPVLIPSSFFRPPEVA